MKLWDDFSFYYSDNYEVELSSAHRFPMAKYKSLRLQLIQQNIIQEHQLFASRLIESKHLELAHSKDYINDVLNLTLDQKAARQVGLPLQRDMVNRALASQDAFWRAVTSSRKDGFSASLAGGTHHAHYDSGEGFCFFNDFAINARRLLKENQDEKILIIDLDVHQGNGNSSILKNDQNVFIMSYHGKHNYPYRKISSSLDREFENEAGDDIYLSTLENDLIALNQMNFTHIFYQAGVDALKDDEFGKLSLSLDGLRQRDEMVFKFALSKDVNMTMALGGGYSGDISKSVDAYIQTYEVAKKMFSK